VRLTRGCAPLVPDAPPTTSTPLQVIAVGPGAMTKEGKVLPMSVSVGDKVLLPEYGGHVVKLGSEEELYLYRDEDILGRLQ
jgi:chaperonin GroES